MNIRHKYFILFFLSIGLLNIACKESFLDLPIESKPTSDSDANFAENLVVGVYNSLLLGEAFGAEGDAHGLGFVSATNIISDDADKGSTASDQAATVGQLDQFTVTSSNVFVQSLWSGHYNGIAKANQALQALEKSKLVDAQKNKLMGEVRFIRAYYYFNLVRFFGAVPKITSVPADANEANTNPVYQTRASIEDIYGIIIEDLTFASNSLPLRLLTQTGRISKGTAQALLAKVYLYQKNYLKSADLCKAVIESGQYALINDYSQIWREKGNNSSESIFEIQTGIFNNTDYGVNSYSMFQGPRVGGKGGWTDLGWGFCNPSESLVNAYEPNDLRKEATIIFIDNSGKHKGTILFDGFRVPSADSVENLRYNYKAYHSENSQMESWLGNRDRKQKNIHILRLADVYLIYAESLNENGNTSLALTYLNKIRKRAGLNEKPELSKELLREAIWNERRIELAMEHDRFFDLVRTGRAAKAMQKAGKKFIEGTHELLPIPQLQIALSGGKLTQNKGY
ncbi:RagB/SusD family nutrient uptake outer membrane protein [Sandaracinomonas limnophila]|uniref:RagB/SusD family nutrient uptake outer membrane protein n=1 Tax=Sandaracinomonas limnophila TaxID=1862386 RepID=A0A437PR82_9BACT|nr:RagB/SusD family nutrient uptake outer membrane protein [Sandaracinomonas limnophila]RVU24773.1 RagB/SusD family nutrient uptake outer membrane protein [Sandaracinomonas limnophila]